MHVYVILCKWMFGVFVCVCVCLVRTTTDFDVCMYACMHVCWMYVSGLGGGGYVWLGGCVWLVATIGFNNTRRPCYPKPRALIECR